VQTLHSVELVNDTRMEDITYAKVCDSGALPQRSHICRTRSRIGSTTLQLGVTCELTRDIERSFAKRLRIPKDVSFDLAALLEPLGVAIHASRRAELQQGSSTLVRGWRVGLLCAAVARTSSSSSVVVANVQRHGVKFAVKNDFAQGSFVVPRKRGQLTEENLQIAIDQDRLETRRRSRRTGCGLRVYRRGSAFAGCDLCKWVPMIAVMYD